MSSAPAPSIALGMGLSDSTAAAPSGSGGQATGGTASRIGTSGSGFVYWDLRVDYMGLFAGSGSQATEADMYFEATAHDTHRHTYST